MEELKILHDINRYDIELYEYALKLVDSRMQLLNTKSIQGIVLNTESCSSSTSTSSSTIDMEYIKLKYKYSANGANSEHHPKISNNILMPKVFKNHIGLFQPPGHKGPF